MVDRPPPSRFSVIERGGRLIVIDKQTGQTPLSAAERMDLHDRQRGVEPIRPAKTPARTSVAPDLSPAAPSQQNSVPAAPPSPAASKAGTKPWSGSPSDRPALTSASASTQAASRAAPQASGASKTIVTGKWWDAKGPRTIDLGPKGQQLLSGGFLTLFFVALLAAAVALFLQPILLFVGAFLLFRFGGQVVGPIGAAIVDKALAERE